VAEAAGITGLLSGMVGLIPGGPDVISDMYTRLSKLSRLRRAAFRLVPVFVCGAAAAVPLPLEMPAAVARLTDGSCVTGLYLSRDGNAVHLVDGKTDQIFSISPIVLASITVGRNERVSRTSISTGSCSGIVTSTPVRTLGSASVAVYLERVIEDRAGLVSTIDKGWRIPPLVAPQEFGVPASEANPLASSSIARSTLVDLGRLHGQLMITYGGWHMSNRRIRLNRTDSRRICRTIVFADFVERDLQAALPVVERKYTALPLPRVCTRDAR
jgi:hypothetical protein